MKWDVGARASMTISGSMDATVATLWTSWFMFVEFIKEVDFDKAMEKTNQPAALPKKDDRKWDMTGWAGSRLENESHELTSAIDLLGNLILYLLNSIRVLPKTLLLPSLFDRSLQLIDRVTLFRRSLSAIGDHTRCNCTTLVAHIRTHGRD